MKRILLPVVGLVVTLALVGAFTHPGAARDSFDAGKRTVRNPFATTVTPETDIYFVPLDPDAERLLWKALPKVIPAATGRDRTQVTPIPTPGPNWFDRQRNQLNAQAILSDLRSRFGQARGEHTSLLEVVTSASLYDPRVPLYEFIFGTGTADTRVPVADIIGTAQMRVFNPEREQARLTKMLLRYLGSRICRIPRDRDPSSVEYVHVLSDADLDRMVAKLPAPC